MANYRTRTRERRRGRPGCVSVLFFFFVLLAAVVAMLLIFFKIKTVEVRGNDHYASEAVWRASGIDIGDNLVFINKYSISRTIMTELPYVSDVKITRTLPDTLVVDITESRPAAYFEVGGAFWLVDSGGKLLERLVQRPTTVALISGVTPLMPVAGSRAALGGDDDVKLQTVADTLAALESKDIVDDVSEIGIGGVYDVTIRYLDRFTVKLGAPESLEYKLDYLLVIVKENLQPNERGVIDMTRLIEDGEARFTAEVTTFEPE